MRELWHCEMYGGSWHATLYHNGRKLFEQMFATESEANAALDNATAHICDQEEQMKTRMEQIEAKLRAAGAETIAQMLDALEDGELLARLGITDEDKEALEALHDKYN